MKRRYRIRHETRYVYAADVVHSHHLLHLVPRPAPYQECLEHDIDITPDIHHRANELDAFGNPLIRLELAQPHRELAVVSRMEIEVPERPYSVETLSRLAAERPADEIFFVMGADSWMEIPAWREWKTVLSLTNHIVVTRPGVEIGFTHVGPEIAPRIVDLRNGNEPRTTNHEPLVFITDAVNIDVSATEIRRRIREGDAAWRSDVPAEVANYIEKYQIYS